MIRLERLPCPPILEEKGPQWTQRFVERFEDGTVKRPPSSQYAHQGILDVLGAISAHKCFYCERALTEDERSVDHHREVSTHPQLAFAWDNLYLCCGPCQSTLAESTVARADTLDPCDTSPETLPEDHLAFHEEVIFSSTDRGLATIRKNKLDGTAQEFRRLRALKGILVLFGEVKERSRGGAVSVSDRRKLWSFANRSRPYSLMFRKLLEGANIEAPAG